MVAHFCSWQSKELTNDPVYFRLSLLTLCSARVAASKDSPVQVALPAAHGRMTESSSAHAVPIQHMTALGAGANHQRDN